MKNLKYAFIIVFGLLLTGCQEEVVGPMGEDDPVTIPPPPPKP